MVINSSLETSHSARNLGFIFDEHLTFSDQIRSLFPKSVTITFVNFAVSVITSIRKLPVPLLPLSFTPNLITVILYTIDFLSLNYSASSRSRTLLLVLPLKLLSPVISLPSYALSTGWESMNASNTSSCHLPTKFSQLPNLHIFITLSSFNVLAASTRSSSVVTLAWPLSSSSLKITDRPYRYASPCLWNQLPLSLCQPHSCISSSISDSPIPSPITSSSFDSPFCSSISPSLFHYLFHKSYPP